MSPFYRWGIRGTRRFTCSRPPNKMILWHFPGLFPPQSWVCSLLWRGSLCWWAFWSVGSLSEMVRAPEYPSSTASVYFDWFCGASVLQWGWGMGFRSFFFLFSPSLPTEPLAPWTLNQAWVSQSGAQSVHLCQRCQHLLQGVSEIPNPWPQSRPPE